MTRRGSMQLYTDIKGCDGHGHEATNIEGIHWNRRATMKNRKPASLKAFIWCLSKRELQNSMRGDPSKVPWRIPVSKRFCSHWFLRNHYRNVHHPLHVPNYTPTIKDWQPSDKSGSGPCITQWCHAASYFPGFLVLCLSSNNKSL